MVLVARIRSYSKLSDHSKHAIFCCLPARLARLAVHEQR